MSIELENTSKTVAVVKEERTWRTEINTVAGKDYFVNIFREISETQDGDVVKTDRDSLEVKKLKTMMDDIVASTETVSYKDKTGTDKTFPMCDIPFVIPEAIEILIAAKKAETPPE